MRYNEKFMRRLRQTLWGIALAILLSLAAGCSVIGLATDANHPTPTTPADATLMAAATPTRASNLKTTAPKLCPLTSLPVLQTGDSLEAIFAWSPDSQSIAILQPSKSATWYLGDVVVDKAPKFDQPVVVASDASGNLAWSPNGASIAYTALRAEDSVYTLMLTQPGSTNTIDLLTGDTANSDAFASPKAILGWPAQNRLLIYTSCGAGCRKLEDLNPSNGDLSPLFPDLQSPAEIYISPNDSQAAVAALGGSYLLGAAPASGGTITWLQGEKVFDPVWSSILFPPTWNPDSSSFLFVIKSHIAVQAPELWSYDLSSGQASRLLVGATSAVWSPQGGRIAFLSLGDSKLNADGTWFDGSLAADTDNPLGVGIYDASTGKVTLFDIAGAAGVDFTPNLLAPFQTLQPMWSPDGSQVIYPDGNGNLWVLVVDQGSCYQLDLGGASAGPAAFSPDGSYLAVQTGANLEIFGKCAP